MIAQTLKMALSAIFTNKLRTFLTMLGVIIGVAALILLVSIADGATSSVSDRISAMGSDFLMVRVTDDKENPIRISEMDELLKDDTIEDFAPYGRSSATGKTSYTEATITIYGTTGSYFTIMDQELAAGRFLKQADIDNHSLVIVISSDTAVEYFGRINAIGEKLMLNGKKYEVVGVLADDENLTSSSSAMSTDSSEIVDLEGYIPFTAYNRLSDGSNKVSAFYVSAAEGSSLTDTESILESIMTKRFNNDDEAFSIQNQKEVKEAMEEVTSTLKLMLGGIAGISLIVGGIGIMNIMLVSVTERTREIGIRKAIGASRQSILLQFLLEAVTVSLAGCLLGVLFSWIAIFIIDIMMGDSMILSMNMSIVWISIGFSCIIGVIFGLYPAAKAAAQKPIDALRYAG